jgi:hypothetical protein
LRGEDGRHPKGGRENLYTFDIVDTNLHLRRSINRKFKRMFKYKRNIFIDGLSLPEIAVAAKSSEHSLKRAIDALEENRETIRDLVTLSCYRYSKLAIERFFLYPQINELFVENASLLKTRQSTT